LEVILKERVSWSQENSMGFILLFYLYCELFD